MCDYSLHAFANRLAREGEELVVHRFFGGSIGLASPEEVAPIVLRPTKTHEFQAWSAIKSWFAGGSAAERLPCAVCVPPGATLILHDIPLGMQREFGITADEQVTFVQTTASENMYRDALRFSNQRQILLQTVRPGQRVLVLSLEPKSYESLSSPRRWAEVQIDGIGEQINMNQIQDFNLELAFGPNDVNILRSDRDRQRG